MPLSLVDPPATEPVTVEEAMHHAHCTTVQETSLFATVLIPAARQRAETATQRQMLTATYQLALDAWPREGWVEVPRPPLVRVTSISYVDTAGVTQTLDEAAYVVDAPVGEHAVRGRITPAYGQSWPSVRAQASAILIRFTAGYGEDPEDVPAILRHAMLRDIASMYAQREDVIVGGGQPASVPRSSSRVYKTFKCVAVQRGGE